MSDSSGKGVFFLSALFLMFVLGFIYGAAVYKNNIWPYEAVQVVYNHFRTLMHTGSWAPSGRILDRPPNSERARITIPAPARIMTGMRAILGADSESNRHKIWLLDAAGDEIHAWDIDYAKLDPAVEIGSQQAPHGMSLLPDGSVLVNFDEDRFMGRFDACGDPVWAKEGYYHHSIEQAADGNFWTWRGEGRTYDDYQFLEKIDPSTGQTIAEISLVDDVILATSQSRAIFQIPDGFELLRSSDSNQQSRDLFHPNDVEELSPELSALFPQFEAGDLLISFQVTSLVAVLSADGATVKWWGYGPWSRQHDPDFSPDGRIAIFNNNNTRNASNIMLVDPKNNAVEQLPLSARARFFTDTRGKHQLLPNGNRLIVIPNEGRVIETSTEGELLWEFNNIYGRGLNLEVANAQWVPQDYFDSKPMCKAP